jgi:hypothetical protein
MEQKKETKKIVMQVSPLDKNLGTDGMEKYADKIRRKDTNKLRKVRKSFNDQGYRLPNIRDLIKRPGLYRLAWILDRMSVTDLAYFWDNWELDPVCVWAYRLAKFFDVPIQLETPVTMDEENE